MTEVEPEDRPTPEQIENDEEFNKWLEVYERKVKQSIAKKLKMQREMDASGS